jgi:membrane carboxypeptidase/penicillin-binding protein PbpC
MPANASTIELALSASDSVPQVVWYVDEKPYRTTEYPYSARLALEQGSHVIQARVALTDERSRRVRIEVE